jgi:ribose transport system substrate-binding protein
MPSPTRAIVWLAVVAASVGVGWYISQAPRDAPVQASVSPGKYVFLAGGADPYWEHCIAGARATAKELGAELEVLIPSGEGEAGLREQLDWLTTIDSQQYDGMAVGPIDPERQTTLINKASEGTTVVTVDSDAPSSRRMCYIGSSNYEAGMLAAQMVRETLPKGGKVVVLLASLAKTNAAERKQGFDDELLGLADEEESELVTPDDAQPDDNSQVQYIIVDYAMDQGDYERCKQNVKRACDEHEDLGVVVATFGYHGPAALEALEEIDKQVPVVAFDEHEQTLAGIEQGGVHATIVQDPYMFGAEAVRMLDQVHRGTFLSLPVGARVDVGVHCKLVKKENLKDFEAELANRSGNK